MPLPKKGHFILHSSVVPPITAGRHELLTEQHGLPFPVAPETTHVQVSAPRYTMPTDQILSTFPPANGEGAFGDRLPQIVLKRRTLPWERNPAGKKEASATPWLALVVVAEGEAELSTAAPVADCVTPGTELLEPSDKDVEQGLYLNVTETVVRKIFPCEVDLPLLTHVREVDLSDTELAIGDDDGWLAVVLANRLPVFDAAKGRPVRYMACLVNVEGQLAALPEQEPAVETFRFDRVQDWSVLTAVAHRGGADPVVMGGMPLGDVALPVAMNVKGGAPGAAGRAMAGATRAASGGTLGGRALDGGKDLADLPVADQWLQATKKVAAAARDPDAVRLVRDTMGMGFRFPIGRYAREKMLRFPVLAHWSFTTNEGATFETLMQELDVGLLGTLAVPKVAEQGQPERPPRPADGPEVIATGHLGLDHRTRRGEAMRAWYRGPCVPFPTARNGRKTNDPLPLAHSADQLRRVIPDGREDLALASAFEIGRLLALSQLSVVSALLRFRAEQFGAGRVRELLAEVLAFELPELAANAGGRYVDLGRLVAVQVIDELARDPERMLGPRRPVADPGRELRVNGELDQMIAAGLGFNLDVVKKRGAQIGASAALEATPVPLAGTLGEGRLDERGVSSLRGALQAELRRTIGIASPIVPGSPGAVAVRRGRGPTVPAAGPGGPDALDALIAGAPADDEGEGGPDS